MNLGVLMGLDYCVCMYIKLKVPSILAMMQLYLQIYVISLCSHKIGAFIIHFMYEYIGIKLTGYEKKN